MLYAFVVCICFMYLFYVFVLCICFMYQEGYLGIWRGLPEGLEGYAPQNPQVSPRKVQTNNTVI